MLIYIKKVKYSAARYNILLLFKYVFFQSDVNFSMPILEASQVLPNGVHVPTVASLGPLLVNSKQPNNVKLFITMPVTLS